MDNNVRIHRTFSFSAEEQISEMKMVESELVDPCLAAWTIQCREMDSREGLVLLVASTNSF
jgi:hypothetical protein